MKISIVIPAYNEELLIGSCLSAVKHSAQASGLGPLDYEIIVVNNASTDRTREVALQSGGVRVIDEPNKGITRAKQAGYKASRGEILAHPDADTRMPEQWLSLVLSEFERDPALLAISGPYTYYDLPVVQRSIVNVCIFFAYLSHLFNHYILGVGAMFQGGNYAVRRSALQKAGGYDTSIEFYGEDTDIARRISQLGKVKWTWKLYMCSSGRRFSVEGVATTTFRYAANYLSTLFIKKPVTFEYIDIRPDKKKR